MSNGLRADHSIVIFMLALFLFNSPLNHWWSSLALPWYSLFLPWLLVIALVFWNQLRQRGGD